MAIAMMVTEVAAMIINTITAIDAWACLVALVQCQLLYQRPDLHLV
jgi:hypothetical protein